MTSSKSNGKPGFFIFIFMGLALFLPMIFEMFYTLPANATINYAEGTLFSETAPKKRGDYLKLGAHPERYACSIPRNLSSHTCYSTTGESARAYDGQAARLGWIERPIALGGGKTRIVVSIEVAGKPFLTYEETKARVEASWTSRALLCLLLAIGYGAAGYFFFGRNREA